MTLRTGSKRISGFTLIEVLTAVTILSIGIIGVIRAYVTLINGIEASRFTVETSYLLKEKIADVEKEAIENFGGAPGSKGGTFSGDYVSYRWQTETSDVKIEHAGAKEKPKVEVKEKTKKGPPETLRKVHVLVMNNEPGSSRKLSLYTYMESPSE